ncbi:transcriptional regulator (plasmid) [Raoultella ornithinolytica]|uniref:type II toxin-antitoxin system HicB family antitoxin n=1 Tax=Raoultella ornithinolytica TaxID=54291 RepID=UPI000849F1A8|nr:type II toxin-antitoxin system HicB family antitoxin [Raoultella ornithinolytica]AOO60023.1 transcriptional regulator [Raoultella ornithinolytica]
MFNYAVKLEHDSDTGAWVVSCRDLPLLNSVGDSVDEALLEAVDAAIMALSIEVEERRPIPEASQPEEGEYIITLPVLVVMKAALHNAMLASGTRKAELARLMGMKGQQIDRLLDVAHSSKVETVELALRQLNRVVQLTVDKAAA